MSRKFIKIICILLVLVMISCINKQDENTKIDGLWKVDKVLVDGGDLTPVAKWMKFNSDSTQTSGNGWLQHTVGTWSYNEKTQELATTNTFGVRDAAPPFTVSFENNNMIWKRNEEGHPVEIHLSRTDKIPTSEANKLLGLWKFESIVEDGKEVSDSLNPSKKAMLFLRWDSTYVLHNYPEGRLYGMFKTHAHRKQIDMVSYSKEPKFQFYEFKFEGNQLLFNATNKNKQIRLTRIHQFLQ